MHIPRRMCNQLKFPTNQLMHNEYSTFRAVVWLCLVGNPNHEYHHESKNNSIPCRISADQYQPLHFSSRAGVHWESSDPLTRSCSLWAAGWHAEEVDLLKKWILDGSVSGCVYKNISTFCLRVHSEHKKREKWKIVSCRCNIVLFDYTEVVM